MEWFENLDSFEKMFWYIAIPSSVLFLLQTLLTMTGIWGGADMDGDVDNDFDGDTSFPIFSIRNFIIFFTVFGWSGIAMYQNDFEKTTTIIVSVILGIIAMFIVAGIFYFMTRMVESGNFDIKLAVSKIGQVYLPIGSERSNIGKIQINVQGSLKELEAMTDEVEDLKTGSAVEVIEVINNQILLVQKVKNNN